MTISVAHRDERARAALRTEMGVSTGLALRIQNGIEVVWRDHKAHHLADRTFIDVDSRDCDNHSAIQSLNRESAVDQLVTRRISA